MTDDTISRKAVLQVLPRFRFNSDNAYFDTLYEIEHLPTVDAVPVRHGHWVVDPEDDGVCSCSECGRYEFYESAFCPNCGAQMDMKDGDHAELKKLRMDNECDECRRRGLNYSYDEDGEIEAINCGDCLYSDAPRRRRRNDAIN